MWSASRWPESWWWRSRTCPSRVLSCSLYEWRPAVSTCCEVIGRACLSGWFSEDPLCVQGCAEGYARDATEIQNIQIAEGDVCHSLPIPVYMVFPRLFTCPTLETTNFKVGQFFLLLLMCRGLHVWVDKRQKIWLQVSESWKSACLIRSYILWYWWKKTKSNIGPHIGKIWSRCRNWDRKKKEKKAALC